MNVQEFDLIIEQARKNNVQELDLRHNLLPIPAEVLRRVDEPALIIECYLNIVKSQTTPRSKQPHEMD